MILRLRFEQIETLRRKIMSEPELLQVNQNKFCRHCGEKTAVNSKFCLHCGGHLNASPNQEIFENIPSNTDSKLPASEQKTPELVSPISNSNAPNVEKKDQVKTVSNILRKGWESDGSFSSILKRTFDLRLYGLMASVNVLSIFGILWTVGFFNFFGIEPKNPLFFISAFALVVPLALITRAYCETRLQALAYHGGAFVLIALIAVTVMTFKASKSSYSDNFQSDSRNWKKSIANPDWFYDENSIVKKDGKTYVTILANMDEGGVKIGTLFEENDPKKSEKLVKSMFFNRTYDCASISLAVSVTYFSGKNGKGENLGSLPAEKFSEIGHNFESLPELRDEFNFFCNSSLSNPASEKIEAPAAPAPKAQLVQPSFDCAEASTRAEKMVCGNSELATLDQEMARNYKKARNAAADKNELKNEQLAWLNTLKQCPDEACLVQSYAQRINELRGYFAGD